jgi:hypothetical protein
VRTLINKGKGNATDLLRKRKRKEKERKSFTETVDVPGAVRTPVSPVIQGVSKTSAGVIYDNPQGLVLFPEYASYL